MNEHQRKVVARYIADRDRLAALTSNEALAEEAGVPMEAVLYLTRPGEDWRKMPEGLTGGQIKRLRQILGERYRLQALRKNKAGVAQELGVKIHVLSKWIAEVEKTGGGLQECDQFERQGCPRQRTAEAMGLCWDRINQWLVQPLIRDSNSHQSAA